MERPLMSARGRVLVVDDDGGVRMLVKRLLEAEGYEVATAEDGTEALALLAAEPGTVRLVVTDVRMPGMDGIELGRRVTDVAPGVPTLYMTAYAEDAALLSKMENWTAQPILYKPFTSHHLLNLVGILLDRRGR